MDSLVYSSAFDANVCIPDWRAKFVDEGVEFLDIDATSMEDYDGPPDDKDSEISFGSIQDLSDSYQRDPFGGESLVPKLRNPEGDIEELKEIAPNHMGQRQYDMYFCKKKWGRNRRSDGIGAISRNIFRIWDVAQKLILKL